MNVGLLIVGVFFLIPVVSAFLLAFTDFDIYALADTHNVRPSCGFRAETFRGQTPHLAILGSDPAYGTRAETRQTRAPDERRGLVGSPPR